MNKGAWFKGVCVALLLLTSSYALAQTETTLQEKLEKPRHRLSSVVSLTTASSLVPADSYDYQATSQLAAHLSYPIFQQWSAYADWAVEQQLQAPRVTTVGRLSTGISSPYFRLSPDFKTRSFLALEWPTNVLERRDTSFTGSASASQSLLQAARISHFNFSVTYATEVKKYFYQYRTDHTGQSNTSVAFANSVGIEKNLGSLWTVSCSLQQSLDWNFDRRRLAFYSHDESITYQYASATYLTLGISTGGNELRADGQGYHLALFDERSSSIYVSVLMLN